MYSKKYELELKRTAIRFVNSYKRRRPSKTLHIINEVGSAGNETTYKFLCVQISCVYVRLLLNIFMVPVLTDKCDIYSRLCIVGVVTWCYDFLTVHF